MAISTVSASPASPVNLTGDIQQLQRWAQHLEVTLTELGRSVARINNLLTQIISLNNLKSKP